MKTVAYAGTRNLYPYMVIAAKSLLCHTKVDRIYFLTEDDAFPEWLPPVIETVNVSDQTYFRMDSENYNTRFTYMSLMRVCYAKLFPKLDRILQLDVDTIVADDISPLWDVDMEGKWFAAVPEWRSNYRPYGPKYYNVGVTMFNLDQIRKDKADDQLIELLNGPRLTYIEQDAINKLGLPLKKDIELPTRYNESIVTGKTMEPAIVHYAGYKNWQDSSLVFRHEYLEAYRKMSWEEVLNG